MIAKFQYRIGWVAAISGALLCVSAATVHADQWYTEPKVRLYGFYDDNVGLTTQDETTSPGFILSAGLKAGRRAEDTDLNLSGEIVRRQYFQDSDRDTTNFHFDADAVRQIERDRFEINAGFDIDSSLTSEVSTSGRIQNNIRRYRWSVAPGWERQVSERLALNAAASYEDVRYDDGEIYGLYDYSFGTLGGGFSYGLSERMQVMARLSYDRYKADQVTNKSDTFGLMGGLGYAITETWSVTALLGARHAKVRTILGDNNSTGGLFDISTTKHYETGTLRVGVDRALQPSGSGVLLDTIGANLNWNQQIVPRWRGILDLDAYRNELPSGNQSTQDRDYFSIVPRLRYAIDRDWNLDFGYRYRYQKYDRRSDSADSNAVFFTLVYAPKRERPDLDLTR